jgi:hypothetical protein
MIEVGGMMCDDVQVDVEHILAQTI